MKAYRISNHISRAVILPEKGATLISYIVEGKEYFYRDHENLDSPERPRCGVPFLFPVFGRTPQDSPYPMEIHGFGHTSVWDVISYEESAITLALSDSDSTRKGYPFPFRVELTFSLQDNKLILHQKYENPGTEPMPYAFGFHPYFAVKSVEEAVISFTAELEMDMRSGKAAPCKTSSTSLSFPTNATESGAFYMQVSDCAIIQAGDGRKIKMSFDGSFNRLVLWAVKGKDFVCVEPINSSPNGLATGDCLTLAPGDIHEAEISFEIL